jgi:hypothetical protein
MRKITFLPGAGAAFAPQAYERQPYVDIVNALSERVIAAHGVKTYDVDVQHDDDCPAVLGDGHCRCSPDVVMRLGDKVVGHFKDGVYEVF